MPFWFKDVYNIISCVRHEGMARVYPYLLIQVGIGAGGLLCCAGGQLLTPSSKGANSPRDASPAAGASRKAEGPAQPPLVDQIKEVVTEILSAVTDEIFREAAREAISNQRRKQRITGKTTIGLKLQGSGGANEVEPQKDKPQQSEIPSPKKREDQEKLPGIVNSEGRSCIVGALSRPLALFHFVASRYGLSMRLRWEAIPLLLTDYHMLCCRLLPFLLSSLDSRGVSLSFKRHVASAWRL